DDAVAVRVGVFAAGRAGLPAGGLGPVRPLARPATGSERRAQPSAGFFASRLVADGLLRLADPPRIDSLIRVSRTTSSAPRQDQERADRECFHYVLLRGEP